MTALLLLSLPLLYPAILGAFLLHPTFRKARAGRAPEKAAPRLEKSKVAALDFGTLAPTR